jgi:acetyl-CoA C-acetyltransferase
VKEETMPEAVIVDAIRTPIGRAIRGTLRDMRADDLAAIPLRALIERNPEVDFRETVDVMMGCGFPDHEQGYNVARNATLLAGLDHHIPGVTVNRFCASSLQTIRMAFHAIKAGEGDQYIAAGVEATSRGAGMTLPVANPRLDGTNGNGYNVYIPMGLTAENVAERCKVSREAQDEWAARSQQRAVAARDSGYFDPEIVGVEIPETHDAGGDVIAAHTVTWDDGPRAGTTVETLAKLKPAFKPNGTVTPGNACPLNDGAAAVLVMSEEKARERDVTPRARVVASAVAAVRPEIMGLGPIPAIKKVLKQAGLKIDDIDLFELNEAFAAQVLPCRDELGIDPEKLNINGGAIALGHPFGMTGARIMTTLLHNLDSVEGRYGLESMCVAGGLGMAMIVERLA